MKTLELNKDRYYAVDKKNLSALAKAIWAHAKRPWGEDTFTPLCEALKKEFGKNVWELSSLDSFLSKNLLNAIAELTDKAYAGDIADILRLHEGTQFSSSPLRRAFRSNDFGFYATSHVGRFTRLIRAYYYEASVLDLLQAEEIYAGCSEDRIALAIHRGDREVTDLIRDMILGDNNTLLDRRAIMGILLSGDRELFGLLMDLLLAAKNQEGLRQAILESADIGSLETFISIFKICIDNDLFRFSSAVRAFYTWTGIYMDTGEIPQMKKTAEKAWLALTDEQARQELLVSPNSFDAYLAVWAMGCREVRDADAYVEALVTDPQPYRRSLGWYFVSKVENERYRHNMAVKYLSESEDSVLARILPCLHSNHNVTFYSRYRAKQAEGVKKSPDDMLPKGKKERRELFDRLKPIVLRIGKSRKSFSGNPFPWSSVELTNEDSRAIGCMLSLAAWDLDPDMIRELSELVDYMSVDTRQAFYGNLLDPNHSPKQREYLYQALGDKSMYTKVMAIEKLGSCDATESDVEHVCAVLTSRSADLKKAAVSYLHGLDSGSKKKSVEILSVGSDAQIQAAMELLLQDRKLSDACEDLILALKEKKLSAEAKLLLDQLVGKDTTAEELSPENGYGLYDPSALDALVEKLNADPVLCFYEKKLLSLKKETGAYRYLSKKEIQSLMPTRKEIDLVYSGLEQVFIDHKDYEYYSVDWSGARCAHLFGDASYHIPVPEEYGQVANGQAQFHMFPFAGEFQKVLQPYIDEPMKLIGFLSACAYDNHREEYRDSWLDSLRALAAEATGKEMTREYRARIALYRELIRCACDLCDRHALFEAVFRYYYSMMYHLGDGYQAYLQTQKRNYGVYYPSDDQLLIEAAHLLSQTEWEDQDFRTWFLTEYRIRRGLNFRASTILLESFFRAVDQKVIGRDAFYEWILHPKRREPREISQITALDSPRGKSLAEKYPWLREASDKLADHMVRFEMRRGQAETPISSRVQKVERIAGGAYFNLLLRGLGNDNFFRGYAWSGDTTKQCVLSCLLRKCYPTQNDTAESLKALLQGSGLKEQRLVEAAMYAPQWAPILEQILGWPGLKKGVWFFQAHCSEHFSSDKETEVAIYSPITPQEFNDGAFDIDWFNESYNELGDKRFQMLYKAAKYITDGSNAHRRSQLYTDAVTGKFDVNAMEAEILDKRNQERLRAYALIPLDKQNESGDLLRRYEFIQKYKKDSRQFGAARRESERKASDVALVNLSLTCGIRDVERMLWRLERLKDTEIAPLLAPVTLGEHTAQLVIDEEGLASVVVSKDGKVLKTLPKVLAKDAYIETLKQAVKDLKAQRSRGKATLEQSMIRGSKFGPEEIENLLSSRTIHTMAEKLLWINEHGEIGFLKPLTGDAGLTGQIPYITGEKLRIAHCHDLSASGNWAAYIHYAFDTKLVQPFKQIFREYYPVSDEEKEEGICSRRYAGYQVQPRKTMGVLKACGWTVDYEEGLQKVCYDADMVVRMYSNADWFSPSDIEAPTLEEIRFYHRRSWEPVQLSEIDPILFSEVMRDFDLAVSTAYIGGVDPEASHSTVEMRAAIAKELCGLLKATNVTFIGHHARIQGKLGEYSVHLGSGVVHASGIGMIPILPVHSQQRGRIFLPFADEDPKTAEIMSKILLLSEDTKIRDPEILKYLK